MKLVFRKLHLIAKHIWFFSPRAKNTVLRMMLHFLNKGDPIVFSFDVSNNKLKEEI